MQKRVLYKSSAVAISTMLIMYVMGFFGLILIHTNSVSDYLHENLLAFAYVDHKVSASELEQIAQKIRERDLVKSADFQSSVQVASEYELIFKEDVTTVLGYNPLPHLVQFNLKTTQNNSDLSELVAWVEAIDGVVLVDFQADLLKRVQELSGFLGRILLLAMLILLIVVLLLLNSAVRLDIYAKRLLIKSMQLVGAREWFILRPLMLRYTYITLLSAFFAFVGVVVSNNVVVNWMNSAYLGLTSVLQIDIQTYSILFVVVILIGLSVVLPSCYFATRRHINSRIDDLY